MIDPGTAYQIAQVCYAGGKFAYKQADKRVTAYADEAGITRDEAWRIVRDEAARRGDQAIKTSADFILHGGPLAQSAKLAAFGPVPIICAAVWGAWSRRSNCLIPED